MEAAAISLGDLNIYIETLTESESLAGKPIGKGPFAELTFDAALLQLAKANEDQFNAALRTHSELRSTRDRYSEVADALMLDWRGQVAEATGANVFFVRDGKLHTPIPDCFLDGITRRTVMDLARARGIEIVERVILPEEMSDFEQCFLTGTAVEVTPVSEIGPYRFDVGDMTRTLLEDYAAEVRAATVAEAQAAE